ncbi:phage baseplate assembly protein V [Vibrio sp. JC009]|uniref:phage baseplate assembly protein V n=1 Tax=Vibrio sp. JC009 TaxID=2912314 RepID=UPI0023B00C61|nr:phage baseplate assembly protein V [Vibrio sp. JC009]WED23075.1 phage baseplate assembly protein V [Vibrio sp. JC009]
MEIVKRIRELEYSVSSLTEELEETKRCLSNIIRLGTVSAVHGDTVDISTGNNNPKQIPFFVSSSGRVRHYRPPTVGEQCILINLGAGDNLNQAVALMGLRSDEFPLPTLSENEVMTDYGGGMKEVYNLDSGALVCDYPGGMVLNADLTHLGNTEHTGNLNRTGDTVSTGNIISTGMFNHMGGFAVSGGAAGGGTPTFEGSMKIVGGDIDVDGYSVKLHHHMDAEGRPTSGAKK